MSCAEPATLYVGGGTPSLCPSVLRAAVGGFEELTVEVNPDDVTREYVLGLRGLGVNRVSMGVQSFSDTSLMWMARRHSANRAREAYKVLREAGFDNVSLDLIFGYDPVSITSLPTRFAPRSTHCFKIRCRTRDMSSMRCPISLCLVIRPYTTAVTGNACRISVSVPERIRLTGTAVGAGTLPMWIPMSDIGSRMFNRRWRVMDMLVGPVIVSLVASMRSLVARHLRMRMCWSKR